MRIDTVTQSVTRPADTTTYTAGDVVSTAAGARMSFTATPRFGGEGCLIESAVCVSDGNVATKPDLELWLFSADIAAVADNAAFAPTDAEMLTLIGVISFATASFKVGNAGSAAAGNAACVSSNMGIAVLGATFYGVLVVRNGYVPLSAEKFTVALSLIK